MGGNETQNPCGRFLPLNMKQEAVKTIWDPGESYDRRFLFLIELRSASSPQRHFLDRLKRRILGFGVDKLAVKIFIRKTKWIYCYSWSAFGGISTDKSRELLLDLKDFFKESCLCVGFIYTSNTFIVSKDTFLSCLLLRSWFSFSFTYTPYLRELGIVTLGRLAKSFQKLHVLVFDQFVTRCQSTWTLLHPYS